jgi:SAM-dependent methyltransferase
MTDDPPKPPTVADRYEDLIDRGVYSDSFVHGEPERHLVESVLRPIIATFTGPGGRILDCGCGPGAWLLEVSRFVDEAEATAALFGFDLTPGMVDLASKRFAGRPVPANLWVGNVLDASSYRFEGATEFALVYAFDVVQQVPKADQLRAVETMLLAVAPGGTLVVFDHDRTSPYGRRMGLKKWLTRHTPVALVPRYYIESAYPPLQAFADQLGRRTDLVVEVRTVPESPKRALVVHRERSAVS